MAKSWQVKYIDDAYLEVALNDLDKDRYEIFDIKDVGNKSIRVIARKKES